MRTKEYLKDKIKEVLREHGLSGDAVMDEIAEEMVELFLKADE